MSRRRLVFGDDGSAAADAAWLWVNSHLWPGWTISVVTARPPEEFAILPPDRVTPHAWQPAHPRTLLAPAPDTVVEHLEAEADPRVVLDSSGDADLMVVGPRGRGGLKHLHIGSTTEWLLARPVPPLAIVRSGRPTKRVLLCADGSRHARRAAATLAVLPWISACEVSVLAIDDGSTDVEAAIHDVAAVLLPAGVEPHAVRSDGGRHAYASGRDVRAEILGEVHALDADLVALGTRGVGVVRRAVMGSTASAVALNAGCTVLVAYDPAEE
jgi:nucleotide-binding universal stress UspA family protein